MPHVWDHITEYVGLVFEPGDLVEVRALRPGGKAASEFASADELKAEHSGIRLWIESKIGEAWNVYVGANPRTRKGGKSAGDVAVARCLFADFDNCTPRQAMAAIQAAKLPNPTLLINSGGGVHAYWRLLQAITNLALWTGYQKRIIALLGSDNVIHDPPRIMRLPGTPNQKRDPVVVCEVVGGTKQAVSLDDMGIQPVTEGERTLDAGAVPAASAVGDEWKRSLSKASMSFLLGGAVEGERNSRLFRTACDAAGCGASFEAALAAVLRPARECGLEDWEIEQAVRSAYNRPRTPSTPPPVTDDDVAAIGAGLDGEAAGKPQVSRTEAAGKPQAAEAGGGAVAVAAPKRDSVVATGRLTIANVTSIRVVGDDGQVQTRLIYKPIEQLAREIKEAAHDWPRRVGGVLFASRDTPGVALPGSRAVWMLDSADAMGAWLHSVANVRWGGEGRKGVTTVDGATQLTPATKREVFELLEGNAEPNYRAVAFLPHAPPYEGVYYVPCELPAPTGEALAEFVGRLNAETELDRVLMLAAILTPGWGGPHGARPAFIFASDHGQGSGKSATVQAITDGIWGGSIGVTEKEDWEQVVKRMLGDDGLSKRCVVMDNVVARVVNRTLEGLLTAQTVTGWRPHHGQFSRPNDLTYYITSNRPSMTRDLADRSIVIKIGRPRHESSFVDWASKFLADNRPQVIADIVARLSAEPVGELPKTLRDRWQAWQDGVLRRCVGTLAEAEAVAGLVQERRGEVDADSEQAERVAEVIREKVRRRGVEPDDTSVSITRPEMLGWLVSSGVVPQGSSEKYAYRFLTNLLGSRGPLANLRPGRTGKARVWIWTLDDQATQTNSTETGGHDPTIPPI